MFFLFVGTWLPCIIYGGLYLYLFREGLLGEVNSEGNNYKQTVQWLAVIILLILLNYLISMYVEYPVFNEQNVITFHRYSLTKVYLMTSFIPTIIMLEYRWEFSYIVRLAIMAIFFFLFFCFQELSFILGWNFPKLVTLERTAVVLNISPFIHIIFSLFRFKTVTRHLVSGVILLLGNLVYLNFYIGKGTLLGYLFGVFCFALLHTYVIVKYVQEKKGMSHLKAYVIKDDYSVLEEPQSAITSQDGSNKVDSRHIHSYKEVKMEEYPLRLRLINYLEMEKPYLNKDFSMEQMSEQLNTNKTYLSKVINVEMERNFRDLINYYRVKEAIRLFNDNDELTIKELQELVGFNNASSFTSAFKVNTGSTPGEWCKDIKSKRRTIENG